MARILSLVSDLTLCLAHNINRRIDNAIRVACHANTRPDDPRDYLGFALADAPAVGPDHSDTKSLAQQTEQLLDDIFGTLFATPKKRRSLSVRQKRREGCFKWAPHGLKLIVPKMDIVACQTCGHYHELRYLCEKCYERVKAASKVIQEAMVKEFSGQPVDQEFGVRYTGETEKEDKSVRFVEIDEERPEWFSENLLSKPHRTDLPAQPAATDPNNLKS